MKGCLLDSSMMCISVNAQNDNNHDDDDDDEW